MVIFSVGACVFDTKYYTRPILGLSQAPFSSEFFWLLATVALSFLFGKNCPIIDYLGLKDSSHDFSANCVISFFFRLHLVLYVCAARFDMIDTA